MKKANHIEKTFEAIRKQPIEIPFSQVEKMVLTLGPIPPKTVWWSGLNWGLISFGLVTTTVVLWMVLQSNPMKTSVLVAELPTKENVEAKTENIIKEIPLEAVVEKSNSAEAFVQELAELKEEKPLEIADVPSQKEKENTKPILLEIKSTESFPKEDVLKNNQEVSSTKMINSTELLATTEGRLIEAPQIDTLPNLILEEGLSTKIIEDFESNEYEPLIEDGTYEFEILATSTYAEMSQLQEELKKQNLPLFFCHDTRRSNKTKQLIRLCISLKENCYPGRKSNADILIKNFKKLKIGFVVKDEKVKHFYTQKDNQGQEYH